jgi:hypothetical protein
MVGQGRLDVKWSSAAGTIEATILAYVLPGGRRGTAFGVALGVFCLRLFFQPPISCALANWRAPSWAKAGSSMPTPAIPVHWGKAA